MKNTDVGTESFEESESDISVDIEAISAGNDDDLLTTEKTKKYQGEKTNSSTRSEARSEKAFVQLLLFC